jgi:hypothetical protein
VDPWIPDLTLQDRDGRCRLALAGLTYGDGTTLQQAADELVARVVRMAIAVRQGDLAFSSAVRAPEPHVMTFLQDLAGRAVDADQIRQHILLGLPPR